jgi:hypothetical protein
LKISHDLWVEVIKLLSISIRFVRGFKINITYLYNFTVMIPDSSQNVYPYSEENIRAILDFYFEIPDGNLKSLLTQKELSLNQIEYIAKRVSENIDYLKKHIKSLTISNSMKYGIDALTVTEKKWRGTQSRNAITRGLRELMIRGGDS